MSQSTIIIEIQNGKLDSVYSNADIRFVLIDRDNAGTGQPTVTGPFSPTLVKADLSKACPDDPGVMAALLARPADTPYF
jgi:hypothetical protein